ncbi:PepSY-associated TM helix domain-containing protein [Aliikangiella maris]|uniref:PepSY-associated TM helix domain-containing protein n=2 Tax=Aliikangiella maris TaxID=3162458 RepID=A0ABV2BXJ5_9GAMM
MQNFKLSNQLIKKSLNSHSILGLSIGALIYLICLSGALVVFFEEFERWEQPNIQEYTDYSAPQIQTAVDSFLTQTSQSPDSLYVVLPTTAVPRIHVAANEQEWFVNQDGSLSEPPLEGWTHTLKALHIYLHLPSTLGLIVVGALGAALVALIISGIFAHPRIFKDAFQLKLGRNPRLTQADIHNRLSVWGIPFYLMIALTGAFIGLVSLLIWAAAPIEFQGNRQAVIEAVYGNDPIVNQPVTPINFAQALSNLKQQAPQATPIYLVIQKINTPNQYLEIAATLPGRLIYSEMYRFQSDGSFINHQGLSDGPIGRQIAYSVYRLHFGHFANGWVKIIYGVLGLALTVIATTGINIWLARRKYKTPLNRIWTAFVWGTPLTLSITLLISLWGLTQPFYFWVILLTTVLGISRLQTEKHCKACCTYLTLLVLAVVLLIYWQKWGTLLPNTAATQINLTFVSVILIGGIIFLAKRLRLNPLKKKLKSPELSN